MELLLQQILCTEHTNDRFISLSNCYEVCFFTVGELSNVTIQVSKVHHIDEHVVAQLSAVKGQRMNVKLGEELPNCGHSKSCPEGDIFFSMSLPVKRLFLLRNIYKNIF